MLMRKAEAEWKGNLIQGNGRLAVGSGAFDLPYSFKARFEDGQPDTNPEELIGAAHAGRCEYDTCHAEYQSLWGEEHHQAGQLLLPRADCIVSFPGRRFQQLGFHLSSYAPAG